MKRLSMLFICLMVLLSLSACDREDRAILDSVGSYRLEASFTEGEFQDYTDYEKYAYETVDFSDNPFFTKLDARSERTLLAHIENYEQWVALFSENNPKGELAQNYDFDSGIISSGDYVYIYDDPDYSAFGNYAIYFFDMETKILYFFHHNI